MISRIRKAAWLLKKMAEGTFVGAIPSYSQTGEDIVILRALTSMGIEPKDVRYLDLGANHPKHGSNTMLFYFLGGRGVLVEPSRHMAGLCRAQRPRDLVLEAGCAAESGGVLRFCEFEPSVLSTFSSSKAADYERLGYQKTGMRDIPVIGIDEVLSKFEVRRPPNLLSLDIEGMDAEVVDAIDFNRWKFAVVCVETWDFGSLKEVDSIADRLMSFGYKVRAKIGPNTIFVRASE